MDELQVPDGVLTTDVVVSLASDVGGALQVSNSHGDVTDTDLTVVGDLETSVTDKSGSLCVTDETGAVILPRTSESEVIGMLLQPEEGVSGDAGLSLPDTSVLDQSQQGLMQAVTLADGTTAYIQHKKGANKFMEGQAVTLEDGTTAIVQASTTARVLPVQPAAAVQGDLSANKFIDGQAVQLEDGTTAFIHNTPKEGFQAIQLEDGTTAYLAASVAEGLFAEAANLNSTAMPLEQVPGVSQTVTPFSEASGTATYTIINASPEGLTPEKVLAMTDRAYKCTFEGCGRLYTTPHHLKVHERSHTGDRPFRCVEPGCGKAFATSYGLKSHVRVHTGEKPYKCTGEGCNKAFKTSGDLQKHVRTHTGERPFKCPFEGCERSFTTSNIRKVHIRTHTGERPYVCEEAGCGRAFASATNYKNHIRIHTGEKPYVCTVANCGKRFTEYSSLYKHHVVHTHAKPYECNHCNKNYRQTSTLAMHKRTAHNEEMTPEAEAELFAHHGVGEELDDMPDAKRARLFTLAGEGSLTEGTPGEAGDQDGTLVINTAQQIAMVSTNGQTVTDEAAISSALQANQQAATLTLQQLQQQGLAGVSMGEGGQIFVVTDPAQLEALQQLAVQQLELHPTGTMDMSVGINTDSHHGTIIVSGGDNSSLMSDTAQSSDTPSLLHDAVQASDNSLLQEPVTGE